MRYFDELRKTISSIQSDIEARVVIISSIRHLLQIINYSLLEWIAARAPDPDLQPSAEVLESLLAPSDGALVDALESLLITAEQNGWSGAYRPMLEEIDASDGCDDVCGNHPQNLTGLLRALVELRNDGGEGHGLPGGYKRDAELAAFKFICRTLAGVTPKVDNRGDMDIGPLGHEVRVRMLRIYSGRPALIRKIKQINTATVRIQAKYYNGNQVLESVSYDAWNVFSKFTNQRLQSLVEIPNSWNPLCYVPDRVTDTFTGRDDERKAIVEWMDDAESRACLVFGDGGVGKTTLVVETLHQVLEEDIQVSWKPRIISFYTAKRWQFGVDGLSSIGAGRPHLMELLVHVFILLFARKPPNDFYRKSVLAASSYMQDLMRSELSIEKSEHLIIIDNAETLIESDEDRDTLGKELKEIARRVGRVLITSRRREILGADPIEVKPLSVIDAVRFLRARGGKKLKIPALQKVTDMELHGIVQDLEKRPLVLEAFLNALADPATSTLDKAKKKVSGMLRKDLGNFLFSDAWVRFSRQIKRLLILMTRVLDVHDAQSLRICASECSVGVHEVETALEESSGIASVVHIEGNIQISFSKNFLDFCKGWDGPPTEQVDRARSEYSKFITRSQQFAGDRVIAAFRTPVSRAAHRAKLDGDFVAARQLYEQAVVSDNSNGLLFDRFAYFLFHEFRDYKSALHQAKKATELSPSEGEVWFTRGLIEARLGDMRAAEASLIRAESLGVSQIRCAIQLTWAYLMCRPLQLALAEKQMLILEAKTNSLPVNDRSRVEIGHIRERLRTFRSGRAK